MSKQIYTTSINATRETVWNVLWNDATYRLWTAPFAEGSHAITDWKKGSRILFTAGSGGGMVSRVAENIAHEYMSIEHLGMMKDGIEDTESEQVKDWAGAMENYTLKNVEGHTELEVDIDTNEEFAKMFAEIWPKALAKVKELSEASEK